MTADRPLTTLLSWTWIAHAIEVDNAVEATGSKRLGRRSRISLPMWTNGLRLIADEGTTVDDLRARARAACNIAGLERWGWISVGDTGQTRREGYGSQRGVKGDSVLRPTRAGAYAQRLWPQMVDQIEDQWRARFGHEVVDGLREALGPVMTSMPWSPPEVHPSDGFYSHVLAGADDDGTARPLLAAIGQALTALTLEHEKEADVSLPLGANILRVLDSDVVRIRDLPALTGLSKEGIAMAVGYLRRTGLATSAPDRAITLTARGLDALDGYWHWAPPPVDDRLWAALEAVLGQPGALRAGLVPPEGCWRGEKPYLARTQRLLADPTSTLPWHPMVLHRGGWPDAS